MGNCVAIIAGKQSGAPMGLVMSKLNDATQGFRVLMTNAWSRARLFCFPYAGGSAEAFREWAQAISTVQRWCQPTRTVNSLPDPRFRGLPDSELYGEDLAAWREQTSAADVRRSTVISFLFITRCPS
jgi:hypothetical protein